MAKQEEEKERSLYPGLEERPSSPSSKSSSELLSQETISATPGEDSPPDPTRRNLLKVGVLYPVWATMAGLFGGWQVIGEWEKKRATRELKKNLSETSVSLAGTKEVLAQNQGENGILQLKEQKCQEELKGETSSSQAVIAELRSKLGVAEGRGQQLDEDLNSEREQRAHWQATAVLLTAQRDVLAEALKGEVNPQTLIKAGEAVVLSVPLKVVDDVQGLAKGVESLVRGNIEEVKDAAIPLAEAANYLNKTIFPIARLGDKIINIIKEFDLKAIGLIIDKAISVLRTVDKITKSEFSLLEKSKLFLIEIEAILKGQKEIPVTPLEDAIRTALKKIQEADDKLSAKTTDPVIDQVGGQITKYAQGLDVRLEEWAKETTERLTSEQEGRKARTEAASQLSEFMGENKDRILADLAKGIEGTPENCRKIAEELMSK